MSLCEQDVCTIKKIQLSMGYPSVYITALLLWWKDLSVVDHDHDDDHLKSVCRGPFLTANSSVMYQNPVFLNAVCCETEYWTLTILETECGHTWQRLYLLQSLWGTIRFQLHHRGHSRHEKFEPAKLYRPPSGNPLLHLMYCLSVNHTGQHLQIERR